MFEVGTRAEMWARGPRTVGDASVSAPGLPKMSCWETTSFSICSQPQQWHATTTNTEQLFVFHPSQLQRSISNLALSPFIFDSSFFGFLVKVPGAC